MVRRKILQKGHNEQLVQEYGSLQEEIDNQGDPDTDLGEISSIKFFNTFDYITLYSLTLIGVIFFLSYFESMHWHFSAIGRIILFELLPICDWRHLKNKQCLIEKHSEISTESFFNCDLCEIIKKIHVYDQLEQDILEERYISLDMPVVLTKGIEHWPKNATFIDGLLADVDFSTSFPCKLASNLVKGLSSTGEILRKTKNFDEFFLHYQNCEQDAMRVLRRFTYRPTNLPAIYSPSTSNWLIWNKNYNTTTFKTIDLLEKLTVFGQIQGSTEIRLVARSNCEHVCSTLEFKLLQGEMVIFTSLWDLEYRCIETGENMAVIMEIRD